MEKVKLSKELGTAMGLLEQLIGLDEMYKFENILSHYKKSTKYKGKYQEAINTVVNFVKANKENRLTYYNALLYGYNRPLSPKEKVLEMYQNKIKECIDNVHDIKLHKSLMNEAKTIQEVVEALGIKIEGVNVITTK
ncbi:hypothetical protein ACDN41_11960 [Priestia aryabhattai]|uniref:hypothetical protein n=1 Tax=Priestia aryabhattai TaxID=412384 RepID=UPI0035322151